MAKKQTKVVLELSRKDARLLARFLDAACYWHEVGLMGDVAARVHEEICGPDFKEDHFWSTAKDRVQVFASQSRRMEKGNVV